MKFIIFSIALFLCAVCTSAQTIEAVEYWIDSDPGFGKATRVDSFTSVQDMTNLTLRIPSSLTAGAHVFGIRSRDNHGVWSMTATKHFNVIDSISTETIVGFEYFWDDDPGYAQGEYVEVDTPSSHLQQFSSPTVADQNLSIEKHRLFYRSRTNHGQWSHTYPVRLVDIIQLSPDTLFIDSSICRNFTTIGGQEITEAGKYREANIIGGPKYQIAIYDLDILEIDTQVNVSGQALIAIEDKAKYQWVQCPGFVEIQSATSQTFKPKTTGNYAVIISKGECSDTSSCHLFTFLSGWNDKLSSNTVLIYPNPNDGNLNINLMSNTELNNGYITICNSLNEIMHRARITKNRFAVDLTHLASGVYTIYIESDSIKYQTKLIRI